jgi:hypothetical protein
MSSSSTFLPQTFRTSLRSQKANDYGRSPDFMDHLTFRPSQFPNGVSDFIPIYSSGGCNGFPPFSLLTLDSKGTVCRLFNFAIKFIISSRFLVHNTNYLLINPSRPAFQLIDLPNWILASPNTPMNRTKNQTFDNSSLNAGRFAYWLKSLCFISNACPSHTPRNRTVYKFSSALYKMRQLKNYNSNVTKNYQLSSHK